MAKYRIHIQFEAMSLKVSARSAREAKAKACRMIRENIRRPRIDNNNLFADKQ